MRRRRKASIETGLILRVPEAEPVVGDLRRRHDPNAAGGVPAHITVLYPFRPLGRVGTATLAALARVFREAPPFDLSFAGTGRFPGVCWLKPEASEALDRLTGAVTAAFPDCPPYDGRFGDPIVHLTVAMSEDEALLDRIEADLRGRLTGPVHARITHCSLYAHLPDGWREERAFPLAGPLAGL